MTGSCSCSFSDLSSSAQFSDAIRGFQRFSGLSPSGLLDQATVTKMEEPRCGVADFSSTRRSGRNIGRSTKNRRNRRSRRNRRNISRNMRSGRNISRNMRSGRNKRYVLQGSRWRVRNMTYKISSYPAASFMTKAEVDKEIQAALDVWAGVTRLRFEKRTRGKVHIEIRSGVERGEDGG